MKSQDEKLESLLRAGDPAKSVAERPVTTSERAAFVSQLVVQRSTAPPRRPFGFVVALGAASALGLFLWRAEEEPKPVPQVAVVVQATPSPLTIPSPALLSRKPAIAATRPAPSAPSAIVREPEKAKHMEPEPEPVVTRVVIEADSTCTTAQPTEHITITGEASSVVVVTESPEVTL